MENAATSTSFARDLARHPFALGSALVVALVTSYPLLGTLLILAAPFVAIWLVVTLVQIVRRPHERRVRCMLIAIWAAAFAIPVAMQAFHARAVRAQADAAVAAVEAYRAKHGRYPTALEEAGVDASSIARNGRIWYRAERGEPALFHRSTLLIFDIYDYDFARHEWRYLPD
ncbi:MAG TPA: hypothetical protein VJ724_14335 [Tahibacter sp.]|nr:hypothetical protein [Tahibacter sp.]